MGALNSFKSKGYHVNLSRGVSSRLQSIFLCFGGVVYAEFLDFKSDATKLDVVALREAVDLIVKFL